MAKTQVNSACPCGSGQAYTGCCGIYLGSTACASTAEALMRSRYTAYTRNDEAYLLATWHGSTRPENLQLSAQPATKWLGLQILHCQQQDATHATVEFIARYKINGRAFKLHEASQFLLENGQWFYLDGEVDSKNFTEPKPA